MRLSRGGESAVLCSPQRASLRPAVLRCLSTCLPALSAVCCRRHRPAEPPRRGRGGGSGAGAEPVPARAHLRWRLCRSDFPKPACRGPRLFRLGWADGAGPADAGPMGGCGGVKLWPGPRPGPCPPPCGGGDRGRGAQDPSCLCHSEPGLPVRGVGADSERVLCHENPLTAWARTAAGRPAVLERARWYAERERARARVRVACDMRAICPSYPAVLLPAACASAGASAHTARNVGARFQTATPTQAQCRERGRRGALQPGCGLLNMYRSAGVVDGGAGPGRGPARQDPRRPVEDQGALLRPARVRRGHPCAVPYVEGHGRNVHCATWASRMQMRVCAVVDARLPARPPYRCTSAACLPQTWTNP